MEKLYDRKYYDRGLFKVDPKLWEDLRQRPKEEVLHQAWVTFEEDTGRYLVPVLTRTFAVDPAQEKVFFQGRDLSPGENFQLYLVLLTYLARTTADEPTGEMVSEKQLAGGATFFKGVHALGTAPLLKAYGDDLHRLLAVAKKYGAKEEEFGDISFTLQVLPKVPVRFITYAADDEFPAEMKILFDASVEKYFKLDGVWALFNVTVEHLLLGPEAEIGAEA